MKPRARREMRVIGVKCSIDDFRTGYLSLRTLRRLALDDFKIDRSFVRELPGNVGRALQELAAAYERTIGAVRARLLKYGRINA